MTDPSTSLGAEPAENDGRAGSSARARRGRAKDRSGPRGHGGRLVVGAAVLGALNSLTFAPTPHGGWGQLLIFAILFQFLRCTRSRWSACAVGFAFGFANFVTGVYWLYVSMHDYGGMPAPLAGAAVVLFSLYLAIYPALATGAWFVARRVGPSTLGAAALSAAVFGGTWAIGEWLRGTIFTGFPWLSAGYAQTDGPLAGFAPLLGVYGVGFALAFTGAMLALFVGAVVTLRSRASQDASRQSVPSSAPAAGVLDILTKTALPLAVLLGIGLLGGDWRFTHATQAPISVRLLQGNIPQDMKFVQAELDKSIHLYLRLITQKPADLIVTPETALPLLIDDTPDYFAEATRGFVNKTGTSLLLGAAGVLDVNGKAAYTNSVFGLTPGQQALYRYDKHHLVPFGEFVPWGFRWFVDLMHIPLGDFARGAVVQTPFVVKNERFAVNICYEDLFGEEIAQSLREQPNPASVLVNSTNLGWFGDTIALDQHLQISRMRALEMQRPVLRATNTGTTASIDAHGRIAARLPTFTVGSLDTTVQGTTGLTPYIRFGNLPVLLISLFLLALAVAKRGRKG